MRVEQRTILTQVYYGGQNSLNDLQVFLDRALPENSRMLELDTLFDKKIQKKVEQNSPILTGYDFLLGMRSDLLKLSNTIDASHQLDRFLDLPRFSTLRLLPGIPEALGLAWLEALAIIALSKIEDGVFDFREKKWS